VSYNYFEDRKASRFQPPGKRSHPESDKNDHSDKGPLADMSVNGSLLAVRTDPNNTGKVLPKIARLNRWFSR
jgi:hypothetical protein